MGDYIWGRAMAVVQTDGRDRALLCLLRAIGRPALVVLLRHGSWLAKLALSLAETWRTGIID